MRLWSLELTAFGPFAGTEVIPMEALTASGLFLLEGPTGAGKSTILDAITFALYGSPASSSTSDDRLHSHFADPGTRPSVTLDFSVGGQRLRIHRVPAHRRPKRRGDGFTTEASSVRLERHTPETGWQHLEHNAAEIGSIIGTAIGLSREQFTQVVLLPQGEFATFLKADSDKRKTLLTSIFRTGLYDSVTRELEDRRRAATGARCSSLDAVGKAVAVALEAAGVHGEEATTIRELGDPARAVALDDLVAKLAAEAQRAAIAREATELDRDVARRRLDSAGTRHGLLTELRTAREALDAHVATTPEHRARTTELDHALRAVRVGGLLEELGVEGQRVQAVDIALASVAEGLGLDLAALRADTAPHQRRLARAAGELAATLDRFVPVEAEIERRRARLTTESAALIAGQQRLEAWELDRLGLPGRIAAAELALGDTRALADRLPALEESAANLALRLGAAHKLAALEPILAKARSDRDAADEHYRVADRTSLDVYRRHLDGVAAALAAGLVDGDDCPVCGATEHPRPADVGAGTVTAHQVDDAQAAARAANEVADAAQARVAELTLEQVRLQTVAADADVARLEPLVAAAGQEVALARAATDQLDAHRARLDELRTRRDTLDRQIRLAAAAVTTESNRLQTDQAQLDRDAIELVAARDAHPTVALRCDRLREEAHRRTDAADALDALGRATDARDRLAASAGKAALGAGFVDLAAAQRAARSAEQVAVLQTAVHGWDTRGAQLGALAGAPRFLGLDPAELAAVAEEQRLAAAEHAELEKRLGTAALVEDSLRGRVSRFDECLVDVRRAQVHHAEVVRATEPVVRLAALANGTRGSLPMPLTAYVLRLWFQQVVAAANDRLSSMSGGRYQLERVDEAAKGERRTGLSLRVIDRYTGESRDPRSLSGGETFYTSLALALGLADVVKAEAGGVELDTLFIDEGFGTLDSETLDQVMSVIDDLRDDGRVIGIVSHVADLKEQIPERLEIRRRDDGSSCTKVVA